MGLGAIASGSRRLSCSLPIVKCCMAFSTTWGRADRAPLYGGSFHRHVYDRARNICMFFIRDALIHWQSQLTKRKTCSCTCILNIGAYSKFLCSPFICALDHPLLLRENSDPALKSHCSHCHVFCSFFILNLQSANITAWGTWNGTLDLCNGLSRKAWL